MVLMDAVSIGLSMVLAAIAHATLRNHFAILKGPPAIEQYLLIAFLTIPMMLGLVVLYGLHRQFERPFRTLIVAWDLIKLHASSLVGIAMIVFLTQVPLNRSVVALFLSCTFASMLASRVLLDRWRHRSHAIGHGRAHLLIVGSDPALISLLVDAALDEELAPQFVGVLDSSDGGMNLDRVAGFEVLGTLDGLGRVLHEHTVDEVVLATRGLSPEQFERALAACDDLGTPMRQLVLPEFHDGRRLGLDRQFGLPFVTLERSERSIEALALKRAVDVFGSAAALVLLSPVFLVISLLILMTMGRPVLYSQDRIGHYGRRFRMHKFRSMIPDAERQKDALSASNEMSGPVFKIARDPRITPLGRILRKFSLDELPQFFNVLSGNMSLVGPRPLPIAEQQQISGPLRRRLSMRPGITGLWQVSGRSNMPFEQWMQKDLEYLDNWSNMLDIKLLLLTIPAIITGRGAR